MRTPQGHPVSQVDESLVSLLNTVGPGARADVARTREHHRKVRLRRLALVLLIPLAYLLYRDLTGHLLFTLPHVPHSFQQYVPAFILILMMGVLLLAPLLGAGKSPHILYRPSEIEVGLSDVVGIDANKAEVVRTISLFLGHKTFRDQMGGSPRRGVLFEGPPGTGKTFTAKAMAKEADVPFLFVAASSFQSMFYGQTNRKIRNYFRALRKYARSEGGAIGFIEEIDAIGGSRSGMGQGRTEGISGVVNELLVQLQSFDEPPTGTRIKGGFIGFVNRFMPGDRQIDKPMLERANVLVVAATNRRDDLDPALIRPGRFDRSIYFGLPGRLGRQDIIAYYLGKKAHAAQLDSDHAVDQLAAMTQGYSPADLERLLDESLIVALTHGRTVMEFSDISEAKLSTELGLTDPAEYTTEERERVATHEAGHATVAYFEGAGRQLDVLSIVKRRDSLGLLQHSDAEERFMQKRSELKVLLRIAMGGMAAEELAFGEEEISSGPAGDLVGATRIACTMVGGMGMGDSLLSVAAASGGPLGGSLVDKVLADERTRERADSLLRDAYNDARAVLTKEEAVMNALRDALMERSELVGSEIIEVIESVDGAGDRGKAERQLRHLGLAAES